LGVLAHARVGRAEDERAPPPDPSKGERYDGRPPQNASAGSSALWVPRVLFFPVRLLMWGIEPASKSGVEFEQQHHLYSRLYSAFTSDDGQVGLRPTFTWVSSFRPSVGIHLFDDKLLGPGTKAAFEMAGGVDVVELALHLRPTHVGRPFQTFLDLRFDRRNDWIFAGIGAFAPVPPGTTTRYLQDRLDMAVRFDLRPRRFLAFTFGELFGLRRFANGEVYDGDLPIAEVYCARVNGNCIPGTVDEAQVPFFNQGTTFFRSAAGVHLDLRDDPIRPTIGALLSFEADYTHGVGGDDDSSYFRLRESAVVDINLWRHRNTLVLRGSSELVLPTDEHAAVPFSELATLGGPWSLRGYRVNLFRDFSSLVVGAEYRWAVLGWLDTSLFADWGGVFGRKYANFGASRMQPDVGFGFRLHTRDRFYLRFEVAYGFDGGGWQIYLTGRSLP
jgi:hypothetical protein